MRDYRNKVLADSFFLSHFYMNVNYNSRNKILSKCLKSKLGFFKMAKILQDMWPFVFPHYYLIVFFYRQQWCAVASLPLNDFAAMPTIQSGR